MTTYSCKYKYCAETFAQKKTLLNHYIKVHSERILTTTIEKYNIQLEKIETEKQTKIDNKKKKSSKKKFSKPFARIKPTGITN